MADEKTVTQKLIDSAQSMDGDSFSDALVFNGQCFLVTQMHKLAPPASVADPKGGKRLPKFGSPKKRDMSAAEYVKGANAASGLRMSAPVYSSKNYEPDQVFSRLTKIMGSRGVDLTERLLQFTPAQMASLVPKIRIYKLVYKAKEGRNSGLIEIDRSTPPTRQEIVFDDFTTQDDLDKMFSDRGGRMSGTGIKSFKWGLKGVNPAEVDANITAELVIHFNTVKDLQPRSGLGGGKGSYMDLIVFSPSRLEDVSVAQYDGQFFEIQAVVGWARPPGSKGDLFDADDLAAIEKAQTPLYLQLTKHKFSFKQDGSADLTINYRARTADTEKGYDMFNIDTSYLDRVAKLKKEQGADETSETKEEDLQAAENELKKALEERYSGLLSNIQTKVWNAWATPLQLRAFTSKGTVRSGIAPEERQELLEARLKANQARREVITAEIKKAKQDLTKAREAIEKDTTLTEEKRAHKLKVHATRQQATLKTLQDKLDELDAGDEQSRDAAQDPHHKSQSESGKVSVSTLVNAMEMARDADQRERYKSFSDENVAMAAGAGDSANFFSAYLAGEIDHPSFFNMKKTITRRSFGGETSPTERMRIEMDDDIEEAAKNAHASALAPPVGSGAEHIPVPFIFFGDLIDAAVDGMLANGSTRIWDDLQNRNLGLLLGDFRFYNLEKFYAAAKRRQGAKTTNTTFFTELQMGTYEFEDKGINRTNLYRPLNIGRFPIHLDVFLDWYVRKVVKPQRQRYFFTHFIRDIMVDIIAPVLSARCFYGLPRTQVQPMLLDFPAYRDDDVPQTLYPPSPTKLASWDGKKQTTPTAALKNSSTRCVSMDILLSSECSPKLPMQVHANDTKVGHTNMRYITLNVIGPNHMTGKYQDNLDSGIAHFVVGQDRGLLKNVDFQRVDVPYMREGRTNRARTLGSAQLRELYNVSLKLYGTPMLKPGQYVYVTPSQLGFGDVRNKRSVARMLGIGGYHLVVDVESRIDRKGYETAVKALHQSFPIPTGKR